MNEGINLFMQVVLVIAIIVSAIFIGMTFWAPVAFFMLITGWQEKPRKKELSL